MHSFNTADYSEIQDPITMHVAGLFRYDFNNNGIVTEGVIAFLLMWRGARGEGGLENTKNTYKKN